MVQVGTGHVVMGMPMTVDMRMRVAITMGIIDIAFAWLPKPAPCGIRGTGLFELTLARTCHTMFS